MSPRAAWRLESLGFRNVHDYPAGKSDWMAAGLPAFVGFLDLSALLPLEVWSSLVLSGGLAAQTAQDSAGVRRGVADDVAGLYEGDSTRHVRSARPDVFEYGF